MPTRKQRRRDLKSKRHQYEFVYVDAEGNELDEPPPELVEQEEQRKKERTNGAKAAAAPAKGKKQAPQRGRGARREPQPPSWNRALKRSAILAAFFFVLISFGSHGNVGVALIQTLPIVLLYVPLMYYMDRWIYRRYQAKQLAGGGATPATKKKA